MMNIVARHLRRSLMWPALFGIVAWAIVMIRMGVTSDWKERAFHWQSLAGLLQFVVWAVVLLGIIPILIAKVIRWATKKLPSEPASIGWGYLAFGSLPASITWILGFPVIESAARSGIWWIAVAPSIGVLGLWLSVIKDPRQPSGFNVLIGALLAAGIAALAPAILAVLYGLPVMAMSPESWLYVPLSVALFVGPVAVAIHFIAHQANAWVAHFRQRDRIA